MAGGGLSLLLVLCAALASGGQVVGPTDLTAVDDQLVELLSIESAPKAKPKKGKGKKGGMPPGHKKIVDPRGSKSVNRYISKGTSLTPSQVKESAAKKHFSATAMAAAEVHTFSATAVLMKAVKAMNLAGVDAVSFMLTRAKKGEKRRPACKKFADCLSTFSDSQCGKGKLLSQLGISRSSWTKVGTEKANCTDSPGPDKSTGPRGGEACLIYNEVFMKLGGNGWKNLMLKMESMNNGTARAVVIPPFKAAQLGHCQDKCKGFLQNPAVLKMAEPAGPVDKGGQVTRRAVLHWATKQRCKCCDFEGFLPGYSDCRQYRFVNGTMQAIAGEGTGKAWKPLPGQTASKACPGPPPPPPPKKKPKLPKAKKIKKKKLPGGKPDDRSKEDKKIATMTPAQRAAEIKKIEHEGPNPAKSNKKKKKKEILEELIPFMRAPEKPQREKVQKPKKKSNDPDPFNFFPALRRRRSKVSKGTRKPTNREVKKKGLKPKKSAKKNELAVNKAKKGDKKKPSKKAVKRMMAGKAPKKKKVRKGVHLTSNIVGTNKEVLKPIIDKKKARKAADKATKKKP